MLNTFYYKLLKSNSTFAICTVLIFTNIISFIISFNEKKSFIVQLHSPSVDLNIEALNELVNQYNGFKFIFDFWYKSDFYYIFIVALLLFVGIFLSYQIQKYKEKAYGNLIVSRIGYKKYLNSTLISQSLYIFFIITISNLISFFIALIIGGFGCNTVLAGLNINAIQAFIIIFIQNIFVSIIVILINNCSLLISCFIKNKYVLQAFPLFIFLILPQLIVSTLGNISNLIGNIILPFVLWNEFMAIDNILNDYVLTGTISPFEIIYYLIPIILYLTLFIILYRINLKKNERDYL